MQTKITPLSRSNSTRIPTASLRAWVARRKWHLNALKLNAVSRFKKGALKNSSQSGTDGDDSDVTDDESVSDKNDDVSDDVIGKEGSDKNGDASDVFDKSEDSNSSVLDGSALSSLDAGKGDATSSPVQSVISDVKIVVTDEGDSPIDNTASNDSPNAENDETPSVAKSEADMIKDMAAVGAEVVTTGDLSCVNSN